MEKHEKKQLIWLAVAIAVLFAGWVIARIIVTAIKDEDGTKRRIRVHLKKESDSLVAATGDEYTRLLTIYGQINERKNDTIKLMNHTINALNDELGEKDKDNSLSAEDLIKLKISNEKLKLEFRAIFDRYTVVSVDKKDSLLCLKLDRQISSMDNEIEKLKLQLHALNNGPAQVKILEFTGFTEKESESYNLDSVSSFTVRLCINGNPAQNNETVRLQLYDPNNKLLPFGNDPYKAIPLDATGILIKSYPFSFIGNIGGYYLVRISKTNGVALSTLQVELRDNKD